VYVTGYGCCVGSECDTMLEEGFFEVRTREGGAFSFGCSLAFYIDYFFG